MKNWLTTIPVWVVMLASLGILVIGVYVMVRLTPSLLEKIALGPQVGNLSVKERAPGFSLVDLDGDEVHLSDFDGKLVILNFWTSWNNVALEQLRVFNDYVAARLYDDVVVVAVNSQEDLVVVQDNARENSPYVTVLLDADGEVGERYDIGVLPLTFFIDKSGLMVSKFVGPLALDTIDDHINKLR